MVDLYQVTRPVTGVAASVISRSDNNVARNKAYLKSLKSKVIK